MKHSAPCSVIVSAIVALATLLGANPAAAAVRTASVSGNWSSAATWGGSSVPVAGDTVTINTGITVTVDTNNAACTSVAIGTAAGTATLTFAASGGPQLTVSGAVTVGNSGNANRVGAITFTSGSTLICGSLTHGAIATQTSSINMTSGGTLQVNGTLSVASSGPTFTPGAGTVILTANNTLPSSTFTSFNNLTIDGGKTTLGVNISILGNLSVSSGTLDLSTFTANRSSAGGTLTIADGAAMLIGGTANFPLNYTTYSLGTSSTVTYDNNGSQTVSPRSYGNLIFSGTNAKSITNATTSIAGNLSIAPTGSATANISAGQTINVGSLTLGGLGRINGTWGGNTSGATYTNTTYFSATTGKLNVSTDTRTAPTITTWPTASAITYGQALSSSTLSGGSAPAGSFAFIDPTFIPTANGVYAAPVRFTATDTTSYNASVTNNVNVTVGLKTLTVTGVTAANKVYDRLTTATVDASLAVLNGVVGSDDVSLNAASVTGTFANNAVGNGKTVTIAGLSLSGADAAKYTVTQPTTTANITAKPLTVSGGSITSKIYNGTTTATVTVAGMALVGLISPDTATLNTGSAAGTFADKNVGAGKTVQVSGLTISGGQSANYSLTQPALTGNITATNITVTARTNTKVYDGTTSATNTPNITAGTLQMGDTLNFIETYSTASVGAGNKTLIPSGNVNDGNGGANYNVTFANFTTGTISARALTVTGVTASDKVYDRTFVATVDTNAAVLVGVIAPEVVNLGGNPVGTFVSSNVANNVTVNISGLTISGADAGNYSLTQPTTTADITAKPVTVASGLTGVNRLYNATTIATIASNNIVLAGIVSGDTITARTNGYTASFADKHVGTSKPITVSGLFLFGVNSNNYALTQPSLVANILATNITVTARTNYKVYDGTTATTNTPTVTGTIQSGDTASWTLAYATSDAGTNNKVIVSSGSITDGNGGANYNITFSNYLTGTIVSKALTVTGVTAADKVYDRTFTATVDTNAAVLVGVVAPDDVVLGGNPVGTFASSNVANNITINISGLTLGGADAANYRLTPPTTTADITAKSVAINSGLAGLTRAYNGATSATISSNNVTLAGLISGDTVFARTNGYTASFADKNVGVGKPITVAGLTLTGTPAGNYSLIQPSNLVGNITNRWLVVTAAGVNKVYDGSTTATVTLTNDAVAGDVVTQAYTAAAFTDKNVGTNKTVNVSGINITGGADAGNYTLSNTTEIATGNISVLPVQLTGAHVYDATSNAPAADLTIGNNLDGANVALAGNVSLAGKNVGAHAITSAGTVRRVQFTTGANNGATSIAMTALGSAPVSGNTLVAIISTRGTAQNQVSSITQTGVTWTRVVQSGAGGTTTSTTEIWYAPNTTGTGTNITVNLATSLRASAVVIEYNGLLKPTALDVTNSSFSSGTAGTTASSGTTAATAQANEVCVAGLSLVNSSYSLSGINNAFTTIADVPSSGTASGNTELYALEKMTASTGVASVSGTISTSSQWSGAIATFRAEQASVPLTLSGSFATNYTLVGISGTVDITAKPLTTIGLTANNKVYDGNTTASLSGVAALLTAQAPGAGAANDGQPYTSDVVTVGGTAVALFADKNVAAAKPVSVTGLTLSGAQAGNYSVTQPAGLTADITALGLTGIITADNKIYDGNPNVTIASRVLNGVIGADDVSLTGGTATFDNKNVGTGKAVTASGFGLVGADAANYTAPASAATTADIAARGLTISAAAQNKAYDGTTAATVLLADNRVSGDVLTVSAASADFDTKDVGAAKPVSVQGIGISGLDSGNYALANTTVASSADITAAALTGHITANNKVYDGDNSAVIATRTLTGVIGAEDVSLIGGTATFDNKNVGNGKTVTVAGLSLSGADIANYTLASSGATTTANITALALAGSVTLTNKIYDGTTNAIIVERALAGVLGAEDVSLTGGVASYDDKNVGTNKSVTITGLALAGADAANYSLTASTLSGMADITERTLNVAALGVNKTYDALTTAAVTLSDDRIAGDALTTAYTTAAFADALVGSAKPVTVSGINVSGADATNYLLANTETNTIADIAAALLTPGITVDNKLYDGTVSATIATRSVTGVIGAEDVSLIGGTAVFADKNVGLGKSVAASDLSLGGADAGNYQLTTSSANTTANITPALLGASATVANKVYDGTPAAAIVTRSLSGVIAPDDVTLSGGVASFADKHAGNAKSVAVTGLVLGGADQLNYTLAVGDVNTTADITARALTVSALAQNKVYDGNADATVTLSDNRINGDVLTINHTAASFDNKNVGTTKPVSISGISMTGADAGNYELANATAASSADITHALLTASATVENKVYDGTTAATIASRSIAGVVGSDEVTVTGGLASFADKQVGNGKPVTVTGLVLGGADKVNYSLASGDVNATADITARSLTVAVTAQNKVYDGNADAAVTLSDDRISGDVLTVSHTAAAFDNKNVGTAKPVSVSGLSVTGADAGNYTLASTTASSSADITAASLAASATVDNKVYDGTTAATIATRVLTGVIGTDDVTLSGGAASFADKNIGVAKSVTVTGLVLGGADLANYSLASGDVNTAANISAASLVAAVTVDNKVYDGTTVATIASRSLNGVIGAEDVTVTGGAASFADKHVGPAKPVTVTGLVLGGADLANYTFASGEVNTTADITMRPLTVSALAQNKVYDGNADATVTLSDNRIGGDVLTVAHAVASFDNKQVGAAKLVSVAGISVTGADAGNYALANTTATASADITAASLVASATVANKIYDGTTAATIATRSLTGVIGVDDVTLTGGTASFADKQVGEAKPVTVAGMTLGGADLANYTLASGDANTTADITGRTLTVSATAQNKGYDGNANATVTLSDDRISGDVLTVSHATALFDDKNVGVAKPVSVSGLSMTGADAGSYTLAGPTASSSADITARTLTVTAAASNKIYDGNADATVTLSDDRIGGDMLTVSHTTAVFDSKNVGTAKPVSVSGISMTGADAGNYTLASTAASSSADITAASLAASAAVANKIYDGTTAAAIAGRSLTGVVGSDDVTLAGGTASFADKHVGEAKPVTVTGLVLGGADMANYSLASGDVNATADITARSLTVAVTAQNKVYDGNADAAVTLSDDRISGDVLTVGHTAAAFDNKNVGVAKLVSVSGLSVTGADAGNYTLASTTASSSADITAASLAASATANNKVYDGLMAATIATRSLTGVIAPDDVTLTGGVASFADKHVGSGKAVAITGMTLTGADVLNYALNSGDVNTTADITARAVNIVATGVDKVYDATNTATVTLADDRIGGDALTLSYTNAEFASSNVGTDIVVSVTGLAITGADAGNYSLAADTTATTADITVRPLTVTAVAQNKIYDGNTDASVTLSDDHIAGEDVTVSFATAAFDNKNVGTAKPVNVAGLSLGGASAGNYELAATTTATTADITAAALTADATVDNKVYDGTTAAAIASRTLTGVIGSDDVTLTGGTASFVDKHIGNAKPVAVTGLVLSGADQLNYTLASGDVNTTADITMRPLTVSALAQNKVYDGNADATVTLSDNRVLGDVLSVSHGMASFDNKNVGPVKPVIVTGISLTGADAANYALVSTTATSSADITATVLTVFAAAQNKVYDGNADAAVTLSDNRISGDVLTVSHATAAFDNKNVGTAKPVNVAGINITGADSGNYTLASTTAASSADITARTLTVAAAASNKVYDGNADAMVTLSDDRISGDALTISHTAALFDDKNVGVTKAVAVTGLSLSGTDAGNYTLASTTANSSADITARSLTVAAAASNKVYDGNADATVTLSDDRISGDVLTVGHTTAAFDNKNVGLAKPVTVAGISITGADAGNYSLANTTAVSSADIMAAALTATATVANKVYDGTTEATIASRSLTGVVAPDDVTLTGGTASFADKHVGPGKAVSITGLTLAGADLANYTLASGEVNTTADITARPLTVAAAASNKVYDGNTDATVMLSDDRISGDLLTVGHTTASFDTKNVGAAKPVSVAGISITGSDAGNYTLASTTASSSADITAAALTGSITANNKVYDGTTAATLASRTLTGVIGSDDVVLAGGVATFADKNVGGGKTVMATGLSLSGGDAVNYSLASASASTTADITARTLTVAASASNKVYDGNATATATLSDDRIGGDVLTVSHTAAAFDNKNVGVAKPVSVSGISVAGDDAGNYTLANTTAESSADITARALAVSAAAANKVYDGNTDATVTLSDDRIAGDDVGVSHTTATFNDKNAGVAKLVNVSGLSLTGADALNYDLASPTVTASADITARSLTITATAQTKVYDGNTNAVVTLADDRISGDVVTLANTDAGFEDANVGTAKLVNVLGLSISGADANNYSLANLAATALADITPVQLTVTADDKSRAYGAANPAFTASIAGFVNGEDNSVIFGSADLATAADTNSPTGTYPITAALGTLSATNYTFSLVDGTLTITPYALVVSADNQSRTYGAANPTLTGSLVGLQNGDNITASYATVADAGSGVGNYPITVALADPDNKLVNYSVTTNEGALTVSAATLLVTADHQTRAYGVANPALTATISGFVNSEDNAVVAGSAALSTAADEASTVGSYPITATLGTLSAANYTFSFVAGALEITAAPLTPSITANSKVYDGTASATIATRSLAGVVGADEVTLTGGVASFADKNAGADKVVTATGLGLSGAAANNYMLASTSASTTADITPATLNASASVNDKVYDSTTAATIASSALAGVIAPDEVMLATINAEFADKNVGSGKDVAIYGMTLGGNDAGNYTLSANAITVQANITHASVQGAVTVGDKVYDGNVNATILTRNLTGVIGGEAVLLEGGMASFADKNVGELKAVAITGLSLNGADAGNYQLASSAATTAASIMARSLAVTAAAQNKIYDGNADATVSLSDDRISGDVLTVSHATASFDNKSVGAAKPVSVSGISVTGADAGNYALTSTTAVSSADITAASLTGSITANSKVYDGTTAATIASRTLAGVVGSDDVALTGGVATFADKNVGAGKTVTATGLSLSGADAGNYTLASSSASTTADITGAPLSASATVGNKVYDGNTTATIATRSLTGVIAPDDVTLTGGTANFADKNVGAGKSVAVTGLTLTGADLANYTLASGDVNTTADITAASLTGSVTIASKNYDGTVAAGIVTRSLAGVIGADEVTLSGGTATFDNKNVGTAKPVTVTGLGLSGAEQGNYTLASTSATATADIAAIALTVTADDQSRNHGEANPVLTGTLTGMVAGDNITAGYSTTATAASPVGTYDIVPALADPDNNLGNYVVTINNGTLTVLGLTPATMGAVTQLPDGNMHLVVSGVPGQVYHLQAIGDITGNNWSNIATNAANGLGVVEFDDLSATNHPSRFYRVSTP